MVQYKKVNIIKMIPKFIVLFKIPLDTKQSLIHP